MSRYRAFHPHKQTFSWLAGHRWCNTLLYSDQLYDLSANKTTAVWLNISTILLDCLRGEFTPATLKLLCTIAKSTGISPDKRFCYSDLAISVMGVNTLFLLADICCRYYCVPIRKVLVIIITVV